MVEARAIFENRWEELAGRLGLIPAVSSRACDFLCRQYADPARHYHDLSHVNAMLASVDRLSARLEDQSAARLAVFFHDAIYDPALRDNEERSADAMRRFLEGRVSGATLERAARTIEATKSHAATADGDIDLVLDLDMAILGRPWEEYRAYALGVMREYLPVYGEEAYRKGRAIRFLAPTLARECVFLTPAFHPLDAQARLNMRREQDFLTSGRSWRELEAGAPDTRGA